MIGWVFIIAIGLVGIVLLLLDRDGWLSKRFTELAGKERPREQVAQRRIVDELRLQQDTTSRMKEELIRQYDKMHYIREVSEKALVKIDKFITQLQEANDDAGIRGLARERILLLSEIDFYKTREDELEDMIKSSENTMSACRTAVKITTRQNAVARHRAASLNFATRSIALVVFMLTLSVLLNNKGLLKLGDETASPMGSNDPAVNAFVDWEVDRRYPVFGNSSDPGIINRSNDFSNVFGVGEDIDVGEIINATQSNYAEDEPAFELEPTSRVIGDEEDAIKTLYSRVQFSDNSAALSKKEIHKLGDFILFLKDIPEAKIVLEGNVGNIGQGYNEQSISFSRKRAQAVATYLVENGVDPDRITVVGNSIQNPLTEEELESEDGLTDRRVDIFLIIQDQMTELGTNDK